MKDSSIDWGSLIFVFIFMFVTLNLMKSCGKGSTVQRTYNEQVTYNPYRDSLIPIRQYRSYNNGCKCPYDIAIDKSECGDRSSWSQSRGQEPKCFFCDVYGYPPQ